jgi:DNA-binding transcriptional ArsR family regulator
MGKVAKDVPLSEITLRKYEKPDLSNRRNLVKKLCLSIGLLQPGDSRDVIVDLLLLFANSKAPVKSEEIKNKVEALRNEHKLQLLGVAESNIRRQLKRLKDLGLIEKNQSGYRLFEGMSLEEIFKQRIEKYLIPNVIERVREYFNSVK